jgi:hypothetical protein
MQLKGVDKKDIFTTLFYELTWKVGWEMIISLVDAIIKLDFIKGTVQSIAVGYIAGAESVDVTEELKAKEYRIKDTAFAKNESGYIEITGVSSIMEVPMKMTIWNQTNRFLLQIVNDTGIEKCGDHCYDKYVDSIEILGHVDHAKSKVN